MLHFKQPRYFYTQCIDVDIDCVPLTCSSVTVTEFLSESRISKTPLNALCRTAMASSCAQMCLQCRRLLFSRTTVCAWVSTQFGHCSSSTWTTTTTEFLNRSLILRGSLTAAQAKEKWRQGLFCFSDLTAKHLSEGVKDREELSRANVAAYHSPLSPVADANPSDQSQMSLGVSYLSFNIKICFLNYIFMLTVR